VNFWVKSASVFQNNSNVIAYELINEPWAGDVFADPLRFLPAFAGSKNLMPLYDNITKAIRGVDNQHIIFYEPVTWGNFLHGAVVGSGFTAPPNNDPNTVFSYHYYCPLYQTEGNNSVVTMDLCDDVLAPTMFDSVMDDMKTLGGASMLTEWGEIDPRTPSGFVESGTIQGLADKHLQGWAWWGYAGLECYDAKGVPIPQYVAMMSRTYAQAIAGTPISMSFNATTGDFSLCYTLPTSLQSLSTLATTTEVYYNPSSHYPTGARVATTANVVANTTANMVYVTPSSASASGIACVNITAA